MGRPSRATWQRSVEVVTATATAAKVATAVAPKAVAAMAGSQVEADMLAVPVTVKALQVTVGWGAAA
jgi:hypothetical protein